MKNSTATAIAAVAKGDVRSLGLNVDTLRAMTQEQLLDYAIGRQKMVVHRQEGDGAIMGVVRVVHLRQDRDLVRLTNREGNLRTPPFIGAPGYYRLAAAAGVTIEQPAAVVIDGVERGNPFIERDGAGNIRSVTVRKILRGRNASGVMIARDQTVILNPWLYLLDRLHNLMPVAPSVIRIATIVGDSEPPENWTFLEEMTLSHRQTLGLLVDTSDRDVALAIGDYMAQQKKALEIAQTFADRNGLKKLLGVPECPPLDRNGDAYLPVVSWVTTDNESSPVAVTREVESIDVQDAGIARVALDAPTVGPVVEQADRKPEPEPIPFGEPAPEPEPTPGPVPPEPEPATAKLYHGETYLGEVTSLSTEVTREPEPETEPAEPESEPEPEPVEPGATPGTHAHMMEVVRMARVLQRRGVNVALIAQKIDPEVKDWKAAPGGASFYASLHAKLTQEVSK